MSINNMNLSIPMLAAVSFNGGKDQQNGLLTISYHKWETASTMLNIAYTFIFSIPLTHGA